MRWCCVLDEKFLNDSIVKVPFSQQQQGLTKKLANVVATTLWQARQVDLAPLSCFSIFFVACLSGASECGQVRACGGDAGLSPTSPAGDQPTSDGGFFFPRSSTWECVALRACGGETRHTRSVRTNPPSPPPAPYPLRRIRRPFPPCFRFDTEPNSISRWDEFAVHPPALAQARVSAKFRN